MAGGAATGGGTTSPGPAVDAVGDPVIDPSANVYALVQAAIQRQDDLRRAESSHVRELLAVREECAEQMRQVEKERIRLLADHNQALRAAETNRIDAIRAVDVGAVQRSAELSATQALTLATQVATSADTLRAQVATTAIAFDAKLAAALDPIQKDIADLRKAQYEAQGQKTQIVEGRGASAAVIAAIGLGITILLALLAIAGFVLANN